MKKFKKDGIILVIITGIILFLVLKDDFYSIIDLFTHANFIWIFFAFFLQIIYFLFESLAFDQIIKSYDQNHSFFKTFKLNLVTKFFNGITPFSTGGQPMQVYFLKKEGFRVTKATNMIIQNFILYQLSLVSVGTIAISLNFFFHYFDRIPFLRYLVTCGFIINALVMLFSFLVSFSNRFNQRLLQVGIFLGTKVRLIKNREKTEEKWMERCNDFHQGATYIVNHKWLCFKGYLYNVLGLLVYYAIPYFIIKALGFSIPFIPAIVASSYVLIIGSFVPIPGASGGIEYGFLQFFGNFVGGSILSATLLIWRTITYYLPMVVGAIILNLRKD